MVEFKSFDQLDNPFDREQVLSYFRDIFPNYSEMDLEEKWYAEDAKDVIATYLGYMNVYTNKLKRELPGLNASERAQQAFRVTLAGHYNGLLGNTNDEINYETHYFIYQHLDDINRRFIDARDLTEAKYLPFDPGYAVASAIADIKLENRQKEIKE
ncbi:MAG: hypothetical protein IKQ35_00195 [Bacilli bacterium]|nr:hypothetical protein [Bacilli bacterium]